MGACQNGDVAVEVSLMYCHMVIVPNGDVMPYGGLIKTVAIWRVLHMVSDIAAACSFTKW